MTDTHTPPDGGGQLSEKEIEMRNAAAGLTVDGGDNPQPAAQSVAQPAAGEPTGEPAQQPGTQQPGQTGAEPVKPVEVNTPFGTQTYGGQGGPVLSSFEDVQAFAKEQGMELKSVDDIRQLFTTISDMKKAVEEVPKLQTAVNTYQTQLKSIPPDVMNIVEAAVSGQDYKSIIKDQAAGVTLDLTRNFSDHSALNVIRQYVDPGITQEKFDELTDANKDAMSTLAKTKYETDQQRWKQATADRTAKQQEFQVNFDKSVQAAVDNLRKEFPDMSPEAVKAVADKMKYGFKDSLFTADNLYKPEAGVKIAMQEFGQEALATQQRTIGDLAKRAMGQIEGKVHEDLLRRSDVPDQSGRQVADESNVISKAVDEQTSFLGAK